MGRLNFGGAQDLSGVFSDLQRQYANKLEADVAAARRRAMEEQNAEDQEMYAKWKAGKISDEAWLNHLRLRRRESLDPEERSRYTELLLEHEGAIADADAEARFAMGKLSMAGLMSHYRRRMGSVERNSPAWREMAMRYGQLAQAGASGGGGGGGGGRRSSGGGGRSSGGGGGGGSIRSPAEVDDMFDSILGFDVRGEDIIDPTLALTGGYEDADDYVEQLKADIRRIDIIQSQIDSGAQVVVDYATGDRFNVDSEFLTSLSHQYIRTEQMIAATLWAEGDEDGAMMALDYAVKWATGPMTDWASETANDALRVIEQLAFEELVAASASPDPERRQAAYAELLKSIDQWIEKNIPSDAPTGIRVDEDTLNRGNILRSLLDLGANWDQYSEEDRNRIANEILSSGYSLGESGATIPIRILLDGSGPEGTTDVPAGFVGLLENADHAMGLANAEAFMAGQELPFPEFRGDMMVHEYDGDRIKLVSAQTRDKLLPDGSIRPVLVPVGAEENVNAVQTRIRVAGKDRTVWASPQPADDPRFRVYRANRSVEDFSSGDLITSEQLAAWGQPRVNALVAEGVLSPESTLHVLELPGGVIWYQDRTTGGWSLTPPVMPGESDPTTGGVFVGDDGEPDLNPVPFHPQVPTPFAGTGLTEMQIWMNKQVEQGLIDIGDLQIRGAGGESEPVDELTARQFYFISPTTQALEAQQPKMTDAMRQQMQFREEEWMRSWETRPGVNPADALRQIEESQLERTQRVAERMGIKVGGSNLTNTSRYMPVSGDPKDRGPGSLMAPRYVPQDSFAAFQRARADAEEARAARANMPAPVAPKASLPAPTRSSFVAPAITGASVGTVPAPAPVPTRTGFTGTRPPVSMKTRKKVADARKYSDSGGFI